ncbi:MAG TPA: helix-turn-helix domain-containing protein, partial [Gemmatimonadales bacterium]|nr:helix-turn-helix domain-containing protein [Gemmatimonadales bacterium]
DQTMDASERTDAAAGRLAAAIGAPARARMLYCLADGRSQTGTELALVAGLSPGTASVHLKRLKAEGLVTVAVAGRRRHYRLAGADVAAALEALSVLAGGSRDPGHDRATPLRVARTCYDHLAGALGVALCSRFHALGWISRLPTEDRPTLDLTEGGSKALAGLGVDIQSLRLRRRRFAYGCMDWTERQPHLGGALGAALLEVALKRSWVRRQREGRALSVTAIGHREIQQRFGISTDHLGS